MIYCTRCGHQNDDVARSCVNCGASFGGQAGTTPFTTGTPPGAGPQQEQQQQQYQQQQQQLGNPWGAPQYAATPQPMQPLYGSAGLAAVGQKRDPVMVIVFTLLTCGIYGFWWWYTAGEEIKNSLNRTDINPALDVILGICTCGVYFIYLSYRYPQLILEMEDRVGLPRNDITILTLLLSVFGLQIVSTFMIQTELNKVWDAALTRR
jgi:hypothetical protein